MKRIAVMLPLVLAFAIAAYVTVAVNRLPRYQTSAQIQAQIATVLAASAFSPRPLGDPAGQLIDGAVRFARRDCPVDSFVLPQAGTTLTPVQAVRFSELTGARYRSTVETIAGSDGMVSARVARAFAGLQAALGIESAPNSHIVLAVFTPESCDVAAPDLQAFWQAAPARG